jgi:hypothetical protein
MACCAPPATVLVDINCAGGDMDPAPAAAPTGAGGGILGPKAGSRDATGGQGCCCGTTMGAGPIGTPTSTPFIPRPDSSDVVEALGENDEADAGSRWSSVRRRLGGGRPLLLPAPFAAVLLRPLSRRVFLSTSSPRSLSLSSLLSSPSPRLRLVSPSSARGSGCSSA